MRATTGPAWFFRARAPIAFAAFAACLALGSACMLVAAGITPPYSDPQAYANAVHPLLGREDFDRMSAEFFAAQRTYSTPKWLLTDLGYTLAAWAGLSAVLGVVVSRTGVGALGRTCRRVTVILPLALFSLGSLSVGLFAGGVHYPYVREQAPVWADSMGIPIMAITALMFVLGPVVSVFVLVPLASRAAGVPLLVVTRPPHWPAFLATAVYALPLTISGALVVFGWQPGGWATSVAGAILFWLFLNARALLIGRRSGSDPGAKGRANGVSAQGRNAA